jgi:hypothetical protein
MKGMVSVCELFTNNNRKYFANLWEVIDLPVDDSCSKYKKGQIKKWIKKVNYMVDDKNCPLPKKLKACIKKKKHTVTIICYPEGEQCFNYKGESLRGKRCGNTIWLCDTGFNIATFFHELIHVCGGKEIDAEAFENHLFKRKDGVRRPEGDDWNKFVSDTRDWNGLRASEYVIWDPKTGQKWVNVGTKRNPKKGKGLKKNPPTPSKIKTKLKNEKNLKKRKPRRKTR